MKQMIRYGGKDRKIWWIIKLKWNKMIRNSGKCREIWWMSKMRWHKWLDMVENPGKMDEKAKWDETND
jgi:hypothetical protein